MLSPKKQKAIEFLNSITDKDKIAIIHHDDPDGICSAILFQDFCQAKKAKTKNFFYNLGQTKLKNLPLKKFNKIIITDVSSKDISPQFEDIKEKETLYTDHHPAYKIPKYIISHITTSQGYIPSSRTAYELTKEKIWLALIGIITDSGNLYKENNAFIKSTLKSLNLTLDQFQKNYAHILSNTLIYFEKTPQKAYKIFSKLKSLEEITKLKKYTNKIEKEIQKTLLEAKQSHEKINGINIYKINPKHKIKGIVSTILSRENTSEPHIFISQKGRDKTLLGISARQNSNSADLPKLLKIATKNLPEAIFGGHPRASGGQIRKKDLEKFKQNLKNYTQSSKI